MAKNSANEIIRLRRVALRKTQEEMGSVLKITKQSYGALENGKSKFSHEQIKTVCDYLGIKLDELEQLPGQKKLPDISGSEYVSLTNRLIELQKEKDELATKLQIATFKRHTDIFSFFADEIARIKEAYPEYTPNWQAIAEAAELPEPDKFMQRYGEMKANESVGFMDDSGPYSLNFPLAADIAAVDAAGDINSDNGNLPALRKLHKKPK